MVDIVEYLDGKPMRINGKLITYLDGKPISAGGDLFEFVGGSPTRLGSHYLSLLKEDVGKLSKDYSFHLPKHDKKK